MSHAIPQPPESERRDLLELVPTTARRVIEVACGTGWLGAAIKARQEAQVIGIEADADAAWRASEHLDKVLIGDIESMDLPIDAASFDAIVYGDGLDTTREPLVLLKRLRPYLAKEGRLILCLPTVRQPNVIVALLEGHWTYQSQGPISHGKRWYFTRRELEKLFYRAGFDLIELRFVPAPGFEEWLKAGRPQD